MGSPPGREARPRGRWVRAARGCAGPCRAVGPFQPRPPQRWWPRAPRLGPELIKPPRPREPDRRPPRDPARGGAVGSNRRFLSLSPVTHRHCRVLSPAVPLGLPPQITTTGWLGATEAHPPGARRPPSGIGVPRAGLCSPRGPGRPRPAPVHVTSGWPAPPALTDTAALRQLTSAQREWHLESPGPEQATSWAPRAQGVNVPFGRRSSTHGMVSAPALWGSQGSPRARDGFFLKRKSFRLLPPVGGFAALLMRLPCLCHVSPAGLQANRGQDPRPSTLPHAPPLKKFPY